MSTRNFSEGKGRPAREADNLTAISEPIVYKIWQPRRLTILWAFTACYRDSFTLFKWLRNKSLNEVWSQPPMPDLPGGLKEPGNVGDATRFEGECSYTQN
jgi:hypothetical protein